MIFKVDNKFEKEKSTMLKNMPEFTLWSIRSQSLLWDIQIALPMILMSILGLTKMTPVDLTIFEVPGTVSGTWQTHNKYILDK